MRKQWIPGHFSLRLRGLGTRLAILLLQIYGHLMSFENQKWSENAPEGSKIQKFSGGDAPRPPPPPPPLQSALSCAVPSLP